ncbi:MAG: MarR family transcriptional regulator [Pseudomonadota bacterium]
MVERNGPVDRRRRRNRAIKGGLLPGLIGYNVRRAQIAIFQKFRAATAAFDLTPGQFGVLVLIDSNEGLSQSELGEALGIDRSTMVAVIDRLEARGLVVRAPSPSDRRSYALKLSDEGASLLAEITPAVLAHERAMAASLTAEEQQTLTALLAKLASEE